MRTLSSDNLTRISETTRKPRLAVQIDFPAPTGTVYLTTGHAFTVDDRSFVTAGFDLVSLAADRLELIFYPGQTPFASDFGDPDSLGVRAQGWIYYEAIDHAKDTIGADLIAQFDGWIVRIEDGTKSAQIRAGQVQHRFPPKRFNAAGGITWLSPPGVYTLGAVKVFLNRDGVS